MAVRSFNDINLVFPLGLSHPPAYNELYDECDGEKELGPCLDHDRVDSYDWIAQVSILMAGCAILAAAILWKARTLPRTPRAFFETRFRVEASFRVLLRELRVSGDWEREGGAVIMCPALPSDGSSLVPLEGSGCGRDDICSVDRSGQLWQLPLVVIFLARFSGLTVTVCCRLISREG